MPRTVSGLIVPFNVPAYRGWFDVQFGAGALTIDDVAHVPLMFEHGATHAVAGVMTDVEEQADGVHATFQLDDTEDGDRAWAEFTAGSRTGFSVGLEYDDDTLDAIWEALDEWWETGERPVVDATGWIRETSHVAIPAFDDARGLELHDDADETTTAAEPVGAN